MIKGTPPRHLPPNSLGDKLCVGRCISQATLKIHKSSGTAGNIIDKVGFRQRFQLFNYRLSIMSKSELSW